MKKKIWGGYAIVLIPQQKWKRKNIKVAYHNNNEKKKRIQLDTKVLHNKIAPIRLSTNQQGQDAYE